MQFTNVGLKRKLDEDGSSNHNDKCKNAVNKLTHHQVSRGRTEQNRHLLKQILSEFFERIISALALIFKELEIPACNKHT